jgi:hypothetical protein
MVECTSQREGDKVAHCTASSAQIDASVRAGTQRRQSSDLWHHRTINKRSVAVTELKSIFSIHSFLFFI